jgi:hypothetical protein
MRITSKFILLLPMFGVCCAALTQAPQQPTIAIESKNPTAESGQPIPIHIVLKNTAEREFTIFRSVGGGHGEHYYSISVKGPDGKPATLTDYGAAAMNHPPIAGSKIMKTVVPGADVDEYVIVSRMFNMALTGTYVVQASRVSPVDPATILKSNVINITVVPKSEETEPK